jgi:hypothetical protein
MLRGVPALKENEPSTCPAFFGFKSWSQVVVEFARTNEGAHLVMFVNLGEKQLMRALNRTVDEENADLVISTAHINQRDLGLAGTQAHSSRSLSRRARSPKEPNTASFEPANGSSQ